MNNSFVKDLGSRIRQERKSQVLTVTSLANMIGYSKSYLSHIETGTVDNLTIKVVLRIARALEVDLAFLLGVSDRGRSTDFLDALEEISVSEKDKQQFQQAVRFLKLGLCDESVPIVKRREFAQAVISLVRIL